MGGSSGGSQPTAQPMENKMFIPKEAGNEAGSFEGAGPPGAAPGSSVPPATNGPAPTPAVQNMGWMPGAFIGTPYLQTYGGQPAPFADSGSQIQDSLNEYSTGGGRFRNNAAARYSFQGGTLNHRYDANEQDQPIAGYGYDPKNALGPVNTFANGPMSGGGGFQGGYQGGANGIAGGQLVNTNAGAANRGMAPPPGAPTRPQPQINSQALGAMRTMAPNQAAQMMRGASPEQQAQLLRQLASFGGNNPAYQAAAAAIGQGSNPVNFINSNFAGNTGSFYGRG